MRAALAALAALLSLPVPAALAHVEVEPQRAPAGSEARLTFEVPNERPEAATTRIAIQLPAGVTAGPTSRSHGWSGTSEPAPRLRLTAARKAESQPSHQQPSPTTATTPPQSGGEGGGDGDDGGGPPIWAGIGLILLAAGAGSLAARARNRRRMRDHYRD